MANVGGSGITMTHASVWPCRSVPVPTITSPLSEIPRAPPSCHPVRSTPPWVRIDVRRCIPVFAVQINASPPWCERLSPTIVDPSGVTSSFAKDLSTPNTRRPKRTPGRPAAHSWHRRNAPGSYWPSSTRCRKKIKPNPNQPKSSFSTRSMSLRNVLASATANC